MSTKSNFTHDEWNDLFRLFNIMNFWMCSCNHLLSNRMPNTRSKRAQEKEDRRKTLPLPVANSSPACLVSRNPSSKQISFLDADASDVPANQPFQNIFMNPKTTSKRSMQERKSGEEPVVAKSTQTMNVVSSVNDDSIS